MEKLSKYKNVLIVILCIGFLFGFVLIGEKEKKEERAKIRIEKTNEYLQKIQTQLSATPVLGSAIYVYDITAGRELFGKNQNNVMPIASLAKIPVAIFAKTETYPKEVTITQEDLKEIGDNGLQDGEIFNKDDLLAFSLVVSSNDGMAVFGRNPDFLKNMNEYLYQLGYSNTSFKNTTGLDIDGLPGGQSTAKEISQISVRAWRLYPELFYKTAQKDISIVSKSGKIYEALNTNIILDKIPNVVFSKTGFTKLAGGTLSVIFKNQNGHYISVVVLGSTREGRFTDMSAIVDVLYNTKDESIQYVLQN